MSNEINEIEEQELYERLRMEVDAGQVPLRVDKYLVEHMPHQSRNRIQTVADAGMLFVNDRPVKSNYKVRPGDIISMMIDHAPYDDKIEPEEIPLDVVYEDDQLLVINKPWDGCSPWLRQLSWYACQCHSLASSEQSGLRSQRP